MTDIASLGVVVRADGIQQTTQQLDALAKTGKKAEDSAKSLGDAFKKTKVDPQPLREQKKALSELLGQIDPTVKALGRLDEQERRLASFRKKGLIDTDTFNDYAAKITATRKALSDFSNGAGRAGKTAKELAFATRGLPAQFTDIATSLASGQKPLTVLLQQGGQIKDTFGGVGPALRAMGGYVAGLINPLTVAAAAVAALGVAWLKAEGEAEGFNRAIIETGNSAGLSADQLADMAQQLDRSTSATAGKAASVLAQVTATGKFTAEQINLVAEAAINMEDATGKAIEETIKEFVSLKADPVDAILNLNESQHFLTEETFKQIESLKKQGKQADAAAVAIRAYADTLNTRAPQITEQLTTIGSLWRDITKGAKEAGDEMVQAFRKSDDFAKRQLKTMTSIGQLFGPYATLFSEGTKGVFSAYSARTEAAKKAGSTGAAAGGVAATGGKPQGPVIDTEQAKAILEFDQLHDRYLTRSEQLEKAKAEAKKIGLAAGKSEVEIAKELAHIEATFKERGPKPHKAREKADPADSLIKQVKQQIAVNEAEQQSVEKLTASERLHIGIKAELDKLGTKVSATRRAEIDSLLAELDASGKAAATYEKEAKAKENLATITRELQTAEENRRRANEADLLQIGQGNDAADRARRRLDIEREYADNVKALNDRAASEHRKVTAEEEQTLKDSRDRMLRGEEQYQKDRAAAMASGANGAKAALEDFQFFAHDIASQTQDIFASAIGGLSDTLTDFFTKGKADWKGYFDDIARQITQFIINQQLSKWLEGIKAPQAGSASGGGSGSNAGGWIQAIASIFSSSGGRAIGGPVSAGRPYRVAEKGEPELLEMHGKQWLIPSAAGHVSPLAAGGGRGDTINNTTFVLPERWTPQTQAQVAQGTQRVQSRQTARNR